jgi:acetyl-CoA acetyltransferase
VTDVVVVEAVRTPFGRRNGGLSTTHSVELLAHTQRALVDRSGIDPAAIGQVIGGCVGQVGMQSNNITRLAWLTAGLPLEMATTVDSQCGSSQQATNLAYALVASGVIDVAVACGVEVMSRVPMGSTVPKDPFVGKPVTRAYWKHYEWTTQFEGAERTRRSGASRATRPTRSASSRRTARPLRGPRAGSTRRSCRSRRRCPAMTAPSPLVRRSPATRGCARRRSRASRR